MKSRSADDLRGCSSGKSVGRGLIGVMADSHGRPDSIIRAIDFLNRRGCETLYHLGDIGDSAAPEQTDSCVRAVREAGVTALKGNNDHTIVKNHENRADSPVSNETIDYLRRLPMRIDLGKAILAHSLPFDRELGPSCMIRPAGDHESSLFFNRFPDGILIRGHSHTPDLSYRVNQKCATESLSPGQRIDPDDTAPCIITCGALTEGYCIILQPETYIVTIHSFL